MKRNLKLIALILGIILLLAVGILVVLCNIPETGMNATFRSILFEIDKGLFITGILGFVLSFASRLLAEDILAISRDNKRLRKIGIRSITNTRLEKEEIRLMFGDDRSGYPLELKFIFVSGINFVEEFKPFMLRAIEHGTDIKIMIGDPYSKEGRAFLEHNQEFRGKRNKNNMTDVEECDSVTKKLRDMQKEITDRALTGSLRLRYYTDQYRYNYRIAIFEDKNKKRETRMWSNFQPQTKIAMELSLAIYGTHNEADFDETSLVKTDEEKRSLVLETDSSFDKLWEICGKDVSLSFNPS